MGVPPAGPTLVVTDNLSGAQVGSGKSTRARHSVRRYAVFRQRVASGEVELRYVPDPENPSDFLTKMVPKEKLEKSLAWATGATGSK